MKYLNFCYHAIGLTKTLNYQWQWSVALFHDVKTKKGCAQLSVASLNDNWNYDSEDQALKAAKEVLKALKIRKRV